MSAATSHSTAPSRRRAQSGTMRRPLASNVVNHTINSIKSSINNNSNNEQKNTTSASNTQLTFALKPIKSRQLKQQLHSKEQLEREYVTQRITTEYQHLVQHHNIDHSANNNVIKPVQLYTTVRKFSELPLSQRTLTALDAAKYRRLTNIQRASIPYTLLGYDVLGNADTGSGMCNII